MSIHNNNFGISNYTTILNEMRKELYCMDFLLDRNVESHIKRLNEIALKLKNEITSYELSSVETELAKRVSKKISLLSSRIDLIQSKASTIFKANKTQEPKSIAQEICHKIKNFFQSVPNSYIFARYSQAFKDQKILKTKSALLNTKEKLLLEHASVNNKLQKAKIAIKNQHHVNRLQDQLHSIRQKLFLLEEKLEKVAKIESYEIKGDEVRKSAFVLGAERISLLTEDHVKLDGLYFDAQAFRKSLKDAGGELVTYSKADGVKSFQGISMPFGQWEVAGKRLVKSLEGLNGLSYSSSLVNNSNVIKHSGAGWTAVKDGDKIVLVRADELPSLETTRQNNLTPFEFNRVLNIWVFNPESKDELNRSVEPIDDISPASGTVILTSGNSGIYEITKNEPLAFLFRNMNVVQFNFRGYGKSEGIPTENGLKLDMEAAYQFARSRGQVPSKILFKALCMSGGPAAHCAAQHPETNIFLDQSYSHFKQLVKEEIEAMVAKKAKKLVGNPHKDSIMAKVTDYISRGFARLLIDLLPFSFPDYNTAELLAQNNGRKAILFTREDEDISVEHVKENLKKIIESGKLDEVSLYTAPGAHGASLLEIKASMFDFIKKDLRQPLRDLIQKENELKKKLSNLNDVFEENKKKYETNGNKLKIDVEMLEIKLNENNIAERNSLSDQLDEKRSYLLTNDLLTANLITKSQTEINSVQKELKSVQDQLNELLPSDMDSSIMAKEELVAMNQLSQFLRKCNLSNDILKSSS